MMIDCGVYFVAGGLGNYSRVIVIVIVVGGCGVTASCC